jgi:hypothetical protein
MSKSFDFIYEAGARAQSSTVLTLAPATEVPTSPRTRLDTFGQFLRPLTSQLIRATDASQSKDMHRARHEAARAYYKLGELSETGEHLISSQDLNQLYKLLNELFHQTIAPHSLEYAHLFFRSFLFRIESAQPSTLSLEEMRALVSADGSALDVEELALVRVAHCARKSCLALLAVQTDLALAYLDFIGRDALLLSDSYSDVLNSEVLAALTRTRSRLKNKKIFSGNARAVGQMLRGEIQPLIDRSEKICATHARELTKYNIPAS